MLARRTTRVCLFVVFGIHSIYMLGQDKVLSSLVQASLFGQGQIFVGRIAGPIKSPLEGEALPTVPVTIDEYLRGTKIVGGKIDLMVDGSYDSLRPSKWLGVEVKPGRKILVVGRFGGENLPARVLDLDSPDGKILLPIVRRIIAADDNPPEERKQKLTEALNDPSPLVRDFAKYRLRTHPEPVELEGIQKFNAKVDAAFVGSVDDRIAAIKELASDVYDDSKPDGQVSPYVRFALIQLAEDPNPAIREEAIRDLNSKIFARGQSTEYLMRSVLYHEQREKLLAQLRKDLRDEPGYADDAGQLLCAVDRTADSRCAPRGFKGQSPRK